MKYSAIVLCAGSGKRTGLKYNKMFFKVDGQTVYEKTMNVFLTDKRCGQIVVVCKDNEREDFASLIKDDRITFTTGGAERQDSVYNGLKVVSEEYVMIHDGARCYITHEVLDRVAKTLEKHDACLVMVPSIDTVKRVVDGKVVETLVRSELYNAQTPQAFKTELVTRAYENAISKNIPMTDDASAVEILGEDVYVVMGDYNNKKITTAEDVK